MRILHFKNTPISIEEIRSCGHGLNTSGGWMAALLGNMLEKTDFQLACASLANVRRVVSAQAGRIESFILPGQTQERGLRHCRDLVDQWKPDLIHIHGTENAYGLLTARGMIRCPTVISLQGLVGPCSEWYHYFGNRSWMEIIRMHRLLEIPALRGQWMGYRRICKAAKREQEIIKGNHYFIGRTAWDHAFVHAMNPDAQYMHGGEMLRDPFWKRQWSLDHVKRYRIIFTNAGHPRKGTECLLDAVSLLRADYPDIQICMAGNISRRSGYGRYILDRINAMGEVALEFGQLNAEQMAIELEKSHVFVSPSFIDNSPNAICEAQLLGMPVISTYTGGVPSLVEEGKTGLFFQTGDAPMLSARLRTLFNNNSLAVSLGERSREVAAKRHDSDAVMSQILAAYEIATGRKVRNRVSAENK